MSLARCAALGFALTTLFGCGSSAPPPNYVGLDGERIAAPAPGLTRQALSAPVLVVAPVVGPDYLDRADIVGRAGGARLTISPAFRWGEPPRQALQRVLVETLSRDLAPDWFVAITRARADDAAAELLIDVERLEVDAAGQALLAARWEVRGLGGRANPALARGRADYVETAGTEPDAMAAALGRLSRKFAADLAPVVRGAPRK